MDDVDAVVLPVGAGDAQEEREPAPEAELPLTGQAAVEDELAAYTVVVLPGLLDDAVDEDLDGLAYTGWKFDARAFGHPS